MLDKLDTKILKLLQSDARLSKSSIADQLGVRKTLVTYRINRMCQRGIIKGFQYITNQAKLGAVSYGLLIRFQDASLEEQEAIVRELRASKVFDWARLTTGAWDAIAVGIASDIGVYNQQLQQMLDKYGSRIRDHSFYIDYAGVVSGHKFLYEQPYPLAAVYGARADERIVLDTLDRRIMTHLDRDPTASLLRIAERLDRSFDTVQSHYRALIARGILLKAVPVIDHELLGYTNTICLYKLKPNADRIDALAEFCMMHPNVVRQASCLGHFNFVLNIHHKTPRALKEVLGMIEARFSDIIIAYDLVDTIDLTTPQVPASRSLQM